MIGDIDPKLLRNFHRTSAAVVGGIFEEKSPLSDANGFRKDVMDAVRKLNVTFCGGRAATSSNYHWKDGMGPRNRDVELADRIHHVFAKPVRVGKRRLLFEDAAINAAAEMSMKLP